MSDGPGEPDGPGDQQGATVVERGGKRPRPVRPAARVPVLVGTHLSHYRVIGKLGAGGMGEVFAAVDERLGRKVALKVLPGDVAGLPEWRSRLMREAEAASALNHPGIMTLFDLGTHEGHPFLVMELIEGDSFSALAKRGLTPTEAVRLVADVADALAAAHAAGVLHRDIKSDNLMRARTGRVKVLDFGLAKLRAQARNTLPPVPAQGTPSDRGAGALDQHLTGAGVMLGTPPYMAPEQTRGEPLTPRSEVFSLGVVLYELLTGAGPFARGTLKETLAAVEAGDPEAPSQKVPRRRISADIDRIVAVALAASPDDRYPDMTAFAAALRAVALPRPGRAAWWLAAGIGLAVAGTAAALWWTRKSGPVADPGPSLRGAARRLTFDPGCEEFPSFTPDGRSLHFDALVDGDYELVAMDLASGTRRRVTRTPGWDYAGAVSPDGTRVAYSQQRESNSVRVQTIGGGEPPVDLGQSDGYPAWSPRGTVLFGGRDGVMEWDEAAGARPIALLTGERYALFLAPFADGTIYALLSTVHQEVGPTIAVIEDGAVRLIDISDAAEYAIAASPSGAHLYYQREAAAGIELVRRARRGGPGALVPGGISATGGLAFSPDGGTLAYSTCKSTSFVARISDGKAEPLTRAGGWSDDHPTRLDAGHVLFTSDRAGTSQIYRLALAGGEAVALTGPGTLRAAVAPRGRALAWSQLQPPGIAIAALGADGTVGPARHLTDGRGDTSPQFTHDGAHVLFVRSDDDGDRVHAVPSAGGEPVPVTPPEVGYAAASPLADEIVYLETRDEGEEGEGEVDVLTTDLGGSEPTLVFTLPAANYRGPRVSPDGERLLLIREDQEVLEIDGTTDPPAVKSLWRGGVESITAVDYAPDGRGLVATLVIWDGDIWLVEGSF